MTTVPRPVTGTSAPTNLNAPRHPITLRGIPPTPTPAQMASSRTVQTMSDSYLSPALTDLIDDLLSQEPSAEPWPSRIRLRRVGAVDNGGPPEACVDG